MISDQDLQAFWATKPNVAKKGGRGGTLTSLISEGGAIGGGALGASIGTGILPGIGTLIGGGLGAGIGAFTGRLAEDEVRDSRLGLGDAAKEGALSTVLGAGPLRLGKTALVAGKALRGGTGLAEALTKGGEAGVAMNAKRALGERLSKSGEGLIAKEFRLNPTQQANFKNAHGEEAVSVLRRYGIKKPEDVATKIKPLQRSFDTAVNKVPAVSQKELSAGLKAVYEPLLKSPNILVERPLGQQIKAQADELIKLAKSGSIPASKVNELRKSFDAAVRYTQKGSPEFNAVKETADALRTTLQTAADKSGIKIAGGKNLKDVGQELSKLYKLDSIVGKQSYLGTGSLPANLPSLLGTIGGAGIAGGPMGALGGFAATKALNSTVGRRAAATGAIRAGEKLTSKAANANPYSVRALTSRVAPIGLAGALMGDSAYLSSPNSSDTTTTSPMTTNAMMNADMPELSQPNVEMSTSPFDQQNLQSSVQQILANGGTLKDAAEFVSLAEALQKLNPSGVGKTSFSDSAIKNITDVQSGIQQLQGLRDQVASSAGGPLAGRLRALNPYDTEFQAQQANINRVRQIVGKALEGGVLRKEDEEKYKKILRVMTDTPEVAQAKIDAIMQQLQSNLQQYVQFQSQTGKGAGQLPTDLAGALAASGY